MIRAQCSPEAKLQLCATDILNGTCLSPRSNRNVANLLCCNHWVVWHQPAKFFIRPPVGLQQLPDARKRQREACGPFKDKQPEESRSGITSPA